MSRLLHRSAPTGRFARVLALVALVAGCGLQGRPGSATDGSPARGQGESDGNQPTLGGYKDSMSEPRQSVANCRAFALRGAEIVLAQANGELEVIYEDTSGELRELWVSGSYAVVGAIERWDASAPVARTLFLHEERGLLWRGKTAASGPYQAHVGFSWLSSSGYLLLTDPLVVDPTGLAHALPESGLSPLDAPVGVRGQLALVAGTEPSLEPSFWDLCNGAVVRLAERDLGGALDGTVRGTINGEVAFVRAPAPGRLELVLAAADAAKRLPLPRWARERAGVEPLAFAWLQGRPGLLLSVRGLPAAVVRERASELAVLEEASDLEPTAEIQSRGDYFAGLPSSGDPSAIFRVHVTSDKVELERGLRHGLPVGFAPVLSDDPNYFPPVLLPSGAVVVRLRGDEGDAWFKEGKAELEQIPDYFPLLSEQPARTFVAPLAVRSLREPWSWSPFRSDGRCEIVVDAGRVTLRDTESGEAHEFEGLTSAGWIEP